MIMVKASHTTSQGNHNGVELLWMEAKQWTFKIKLLHVNSFIFDHMSKPFMR